MNWFVFSLISMLSFVGYSLLLKTAVSNHKMPPVAFLAFSKLIAAVFFLPLMIWEPIRFPNSLLIWLIMAISILIWAIGNIFDVKSYRLTEVSHISLIKSLSPILTLFIGFAVFGEVFSPLKIIGTILIVFGIGLLYFHKNLVKLDQGKKIQFLATFVMSIGICFDKFLLNYFSPAFYLFIGFLGIPITMLILQKKAAGKILNLVRSQNKNPILIWLSFLLAVGSFSLMLAYKTGEISRVTPIISSGTLLLVLSGIIFLGEKKHLARKLLAMILGFIGVILLNQ